MSIDVCGTDFGIVRLDKSARYMDSLDPNWRQIVHNKRYRSRHAKRLRERLAAIEAAAATMAEVEWVAGGVLSKW